MVTRDSMWLCLQPFLIAEDMKINYTGVMIMGKVVPQWQSQWKDLYIIIVYFKYVDSE